MALDYNSEVAAGTITVNYEIPPGQNCTYLIVSAGRVEGISSTDKQSIIVFLQKNFNKVVTLILKNNSNLFVTST